jgi:hypothetical protein
MNMSIDGNNLFHLPPGSIGKRILCRAERTPKCLEPPLQPILYGSLDVPRLSYPRFPEKSTSRVGLRQRIQLMESWQEEIPDDEPSNLERSRNEAGNPVRRLFVPKRYPCLRL